MKWYRTVALLLVLIGCRDNVDSPKPTKILASLGSSNYISSTQLTSDSFYPFTPNWTISPGIKPTLARYRYMCFSEQFWHPWAIISTDGSGFMSCPGSPDYYQAQIQLNDSFTTSISTVHQRIDSTSEPVAQATPSWIIMTSGWNFNWPRRCAMSGQTQGTCYYVDPVNGSDGNNGSFGSPFRTLQHAADIVNPGDGVVALNGVYTGGTKIVNITRSGTSTNWITFTAQHVGGAIIDGQNNTSSVGFEISGNYIRVDGFEIKNLLWAGIEGFAGNLNVAVNHDILILKNNIHDIGRVCDDGTNGHVGINAYAGNMTIEQNQIHDIGRFGPGENGCNPTTTNWQGHDHGVYHSVGDSLVLLSNVFWNDIHGWPYHRFNGTSVTASGVYILNNTFSGTNPNKIGQAIIASPTVRLTFANNIFYQPLIGAINFSASTGGTWVGAIVENSISTNALTNSGVTGLTLSANLTNTNPLLVNPASFDFHLQSGSPGLNSGVYLTGLTTMDYDGIKRPVGSGTDRGAYDQP